jgi:uncharacterized protein
VKTIYCAFNVTRQSFINLGVTVAGTPLARLRGLLGKVRMRSDEAVWVVPSHGIHTIGLRFAIDVIYLDAQMRVVYEIENVGPLRIPPVKWNCASVLQLPARSIFDSGTQVGDQLVIGSAEDLQSYWESQRTNAGQEDAHSSPAKAGASGRTPAKWVAQWVFGRSPGRE